MNLTNKRGRVLAILAGVAVFALLVSGGAVLLAQPRTMTTSNVWKSPGYPDGDMLGPLTTSKVGFYGTDPIVRRADASQVAITDNSTGTVGDTFAAGVGVHTISIPLSLVGITGNGDVITTYTPGYKFKILAVDFRVTKVVTTAAKAATLNLEIGTTDLTGGVVALTSANCTPLGAAVAGTAVTAANTGSATDHFSVEAASVTAFAEGDGVLFVKIQNMDTADAAASIADKLNEWRTVVVNLGLAKGAS